MNRKSSIKLIKGNIDFNFAAQTMRIFIIHVGEYIVCVTLLWNCKAITIYIALKRGNVRINHAYSRSRIVVYQNQPYLLRSHKFKH